MSRLAIACDLRKAIKAGIETQNPVNFMLLHYCKVHGVSCREAGISENKLFRAFHDCLINRQHLIHNGEQGIESWLDCVAAIYGDVPVQDLLKHFGVA